MPGFCGQADIQYAINSTSADSLHNWVEKLDLTCRPGWQIGLLGSALFAGWSSTLLWVPPFADRFGRYKIFVWGCVVNLALYTVLMLSHSYWLSVACIFFIGALESIRISIGFNYCMELMHEPDRAFYGAVWNVNEGLIYFWATLYFGYVAKTWFPFVSIGYLLAIISTVGVFFYPESPCYLIKKQMYEEAEKSFAYIARINGKSFSFDQKFFTNENDKIETSVSIEHEANTVQGKEPNTSATLDRSYQLSDQENTKDKHSVWYFLKQTDILINVILMSFSWLASSFNYYMVVFLLKYFPGNVYINSGVSSLSECAACVLAGFIYAYFGVKKAFISQYALSTIGGLGIVIYEVSVGFYSGDSSASSNGWLFPVLVLVAKFGISAAFTLNYICMMDLFPVLFASSAYGFCNFLARVFTIFAP